MIKTIRVVLVAAILTQSFNAVHGQTLSIVTKDTKVTIVYDRYSSKLDSISANLLAEDIEEVTSFKPAVVTNISNVKGEVIVIGGVQSTLIKQLLNKRDSLLQKISGKWESYGYFMLNNPSSNISKALIIAGSDARGTAYGVFDLSKKIGVSPWHWWADVPVKKQRELTVQIPEFISPEPAVKYRGIFINDEDWGLQPWAARTFEPETGDIGPKTYAKVFELLLRLKANLIWPAMHPSTKAFFHYPGNIKMAEAFQIVIGSSHAEPMLRNNVDEWDRKTMGDYNYVTNRERVYKYWEERVKQSKWINGIYTIGMRGVHDSQMEGVNNMDETVDLLERIFKDQRELLSQHLKDSVAKIPQVFTAYKEVLNVYDNGLKVPDDVTIVWPDDNYGYLQRLNNEKEYARIGGSGIYYHASYWGRPHDYLWLSSTHPSLIREEMMKAFETGSNKLWVLNVGDIKPLEYNIQMFLDMAYDPSPFKDSRFTKGHLRNWLLEIFGAEKADTMQAILWEYYQLAFERRPEFMGWSQTEPNTETKYTGYNHFCYGDEAQRRIDLYTALERKAKEMRTVIKPESFDAFYQLIYYPVVTSSLMNKKFLYRDKAYLYGLQNRVSAFDYNELSKAAYDSIVLETNYYNTQLAKGKWNHIMSMNPRNLAVYQPPVLPALNISEDELWNISPEGVFMPDSSNAKEAEPLSLPTFDNINNQRFFVDVFLMKNQELDWKATASHSCIRLSQNNGWLFPETGHRQVRIWITIDWSKVLPGQKIKEKIIFSGGKKQINLDIRAVKLNNTTLSERKGVIENNGYVSINAANFSKKVAKAPFEWRIIEGLGYAGDCLQALPLMINKSVSVLPDIIKRNHSFTEYEFYNFSAANPIVSIFALPTHPLNDNYGVRYAICIDDGPLKIVDIKTVGRSDVWKQNVLRNRAESKIEMPGISAGRHTLRLYCIDPGVIINEVLIDLGGLKKVYGSVSRAEGL